MLQGIKNFFTMLPPWVTYGLISLGAIIVLAILLVSVSKKFPGVLSWLLSWLWYILPLTAVCFLFIWLYGLAKDLFVGFVDWTSSWSFVLTTTLWIVLLVAVIILFIWLLITNKTTWFKTLTNLVVIALAILIGFTFAGRVKQYLYMLFADHTPEIVYVSNAPCAPAAPLAGKQLIYGKNHLEKGERIWINFANEEKWFYFVSKEDNDVLFTFTSPNSLVSWTKKYSMKNGNQSDSYIKGKPEFGNYFVTVTKDVDIYIEKTMRRVP